MCTCSNRCVSWACNQVQWHRKIHNAAVNGVFWSNSTRQTPRFGKVAARCLSTWCLQSNRTQQTLTADWREKVVLQTWDTAMFYVLLTVLGYSSKQIMSCSTRSPVPGTEDATDHEHSGGSREHLDARGMVFDVLWMAKLDPRASL